MGLPVFLGALVRPAHERPTEAKARQVTKIKELGAALTASSMFTLDEQARELGLSRSTAWACAATLAAIPAGESPANRGVQTLL
jgi:hypothetical protein